MKWRKETTTVMIDWRRLKYSFFHASRGLSEAWKTQQNFKIEIFVGIIVFILGALLQISLIDWVIITVSVVLVLVLELTNTSIEYLADLVRSEYSVVVKYIKDISAAAVLVSVLLSIILGSIVFIPKIIAYF